jgi:hypothetical protein
VGSQAAPVGAGMDDQLGRARAAPAPAASVRQPPASPDPARPRPIRLPESWSRAAYVAAALAFASSAVSLFWTVGGTWLLDTVGGSIERLARTRSAGALMLGAAAVLAKLLAGFLALGLVRPWGARLWARLLMAANTLASVILLTWGGANACVGALVLSGVISPTSDPDKRALVWHVFVWDLWFVVWGVMLALAVAGYRRERRAASHRARDPSDRCTHPHPAPRRAAPPRRMSVETHSTIAEPTGTVRGLKTRK